MSDKRLIDANALVDKISLYWGLTHQNQLISATTKLATADAMCKLLGEAAKCQTIDAVEVVRCKECSYNENEDVCPFVRVNCGENWCEIIIPRPDGFCHLGKKMDGGADK